MAGAGSTGLGADTDASTAVVARSTESAALLTTCVAAFSTLRVTARTVFAVLLIDDCAWRFADFTVLRVAAVALRTALRAVRAALRATLRTVLRVTALLRALFLRAAGRRLLRVERRLAAFLAFFLAAICHLPILLTPTPRRPIATRGHHAMARARGCQSEKIGGAEGDRTLDLRIANATLSQLSYRPTMRAGIVMSRCPSSKQTGLFLADVQGRIV